MSRIVVDASTGSVQIDEGFTLVDIGDIEALRSAKLSNIAAKADALLSVGAPVTGGLHVALDDGSRADLTAMATTATAAAPGAVPWPDSYSRGWITVENIRIPLATPADGLALAASGKENATRTEYRQLDRAITKGQEAGWTPDEIAAIQAVSRGTPAQNVARNIGRMAPTGPVSFAATTGVPFMAGNAMGGPYAGALMAAGAAGTGYAGRAAANIMQNKNVQLAELLTRNGGPLKYGVDQATKDAIARAILAQGVQFASEK